MISGGETHYPLPMALRKPLKFNLWLIGLLSLAFTQASAVDTRLDPKAQADLDDLMTQIHANELKSDSKRQSARELAQQSEALRSEIINLSGHESLSEKRAAAYRARLMQLNIEEADLTHKLGAMRTRQARLLSGLQIYARNPPPILFVSSRRANDAVMVAIMLKAMTPELKKRAEVLAEQNRKLVTTRRKAALQSEAVFVSEADISQQRQRISSLMGERAAIEDQLLSEADQLDVVRERLKARAQAIRDHRPLTEMFSPPRAEDPHQLAAPEVGSMQNTFHPLDRGQPYQGGLRFDAAPGAAVTAPASGEVEFAGPLGLYRQVVILKITSQNRLILAGMGLVYVEKGAHVARGEPLGRLPNQSDPKPWLYVEVRNLDQTVDPKAWFKT